MSDISTDEPTVLEKAIEANTKAEEALTQETPDVEKSQAWSSVAANWLSMVDPRSPEVRRLMRPRR